MYTTCIIRFTKIYIHSDRRFCRKENYEERIILKISDWTCTDGETKVILKIFVYHYLIKRKEKGCVMNDTMKAINMLTDDLNNCKSAIA